MNIKTHTAVDLRTQRPVENFSYDKNKFEAHDPTTDKVLWSADLPASPKGTVAVTDKFVTVVTVGGGERITCFNRETGKQQWTRPFMGQTMMDSVYAAGDDRVVTFNKNDFTLHAFDPNTGNQAWKVAVGDYLKGVPTGLAGQLAVNRLFGDTVIFSADNGERSKA